MRCIRHRRDTHLSCSWCAKPLCKECEQGGEPPKVYCGDCVERLEKQ